MKLFSSAYLLLAINSGYKIFERFSVFNLLMLQDMLLSSYSQLFFQFYIIGIFLSISVLSGDGKHLSASTT